MFHGGTDLSCLGEVLSNTGRKKELSAPPNLVEDALVVRSRVMECAHLQGGSVNGEVQVDSVYPDPPGPVTVPTGEVGEVYMFVVSARQT